MLTPFTKKSLFFCPRTRSKSNSYTALRHIRMFNWEKSCGGGNAQKIFAFFVPRPRNQIHSPNQEWGIVAGKACTGKGPVCFACAGLPNFGPTAEALPECFTNSKGAATNWCIWCRGNRSRRFPSTTRWSTSRISCRRTSRDPHAVALGPSDNSARSAREHLHTVSDRGLPHGRLKQPSLAAIDADFAALFVRLR